MRGHVFGLTKELEQALYREKEVRGRTGAEIVRQALIEYFSRHGVTPGEYAYHLREKRVAAAIQEKALLEARLDKLDRWLNGKYSGP